MCHFSVIYSFCADDHARVVLPALAGMTNSEGNYIAAAFVDVGHMVLCCAIVSSTGFF